MNQERNTSTPVEGESDELYAVRKKIQPRSVSGIFASLRIWGVVLTQLVFYGLPWLTWNDRPAILFDLLTRRFYIFGTVFFPRTLSISPACW